MVRHIQYTLHFLLLIHNTEDAPAPAALHSFQTHIADGKIYVTADPANTAKEKKSRPPKLLSSGSEVGGAGVVIVGGGSGAFHATEGLREVSHGSLLAGQNRILTFPARVQSADHDHLARNICTHRQVRHRILVLLLKIGGLSSAPFRTKLSKALITEASKLEWRTPADLKIKYGTTLRVGTVSLSSIPISRLSILTRKQAVTSVDSSNKTVTLEDGKEKIPYDTLILASGGVPRRLPIEGANLENVYTLRTVQDAQKIDSGKRFPASAARWLT